MAHNYSLAYRRSIHDRRPFNTNVYTPSILPLVKALFREELEAAKKRVRIINTRFGRKYQYVPSQAYIRMLSKQIKQPFLID